MKEMVLRVFCVGGDRQISQKHTMGAMHYMTLIVLYA